MGTSDGKKLNRSSKMWRKLLMTAPSIMWRMMSKCRYWPSALWSSANQINSQKTWVTLRMTAAGNEAITCKGARRCCSWDGKTITSGHSENQKNDLDSRRQRSYQREERNHGLWRIGVEHKLIPGGPGIVGAVRLRDGKSFLESPVQHLYPTELSCYRNIQAGTARSDACAPEFQSRCAAVSAHEPIAALAEDEL